MIQNITNGQEFEEAINSITYDEVKSALNELYLQKLGFEDEIDQILNNLNSYDSGGELIFPLTDTKSQDIDAQSDSNETTNQWSFNAWSLLN